MAKNKEKIIVANWKMQLGIKESINLAKQMHKKFLNFKAATVGICPNFASLSEVNKVLNGSKIKLGAQDVFWENKGAYTGEISPAVLKEAGCELVIIGHSERRKYARENYEMIHKKTKACIDAGLTPIVCIGESWEERKTDKRDYVLVDQLQLALGGLNISGSQQVIIAYEPIWAIGTGSAIERQEAEYAHKIIALSLNQILPMEVVKKNLRIIYGGSISAKNAKDFVGLANHDGLLVGGASLDAEEFYKVASIISK